MAQIQTQQIGINGIAPAYQAAANGDEFVPDGRTFVHVKNGDASGHNVTITTPGTAFGEAIADDVVTVPAAGERMFGPFDPAGFAGSDGLAAIAYAALTSMTVGVFRV